MEVNTDGSEQNVGTDWKFTRIMVSISRWMSIIAAVIICLMMVLNITDVAGRYFFNRPLLGAYELISILMIGAGAFGLAFCEFGKRHIKVGAFVDLLPPRVQAFFDVLAYFISLVVYTLISWQMFIRTAAYVARGEGSFSEELGIPFGPVYMVFAIGLAAFGIVLLLRLIESFIKVIK